MSFQLEEYRQIADLVMKAEHGTADEKGYELQLLQRTTEIRWTRYDSYTLSVPLHDVNAERDLKARHPALVSPLEHDDGWIDLLDATFSWIEETGHGDTWKTSQVKEKFAGLRLYFYGDPGELGRDIISAAESLSVRICEVCGAPGRRSGRGWIRTLCEEHRK